MGMMLLFYCFLLKYGYTRIVKQSSRTVMSLNPNNIFHFTNSNWMPNIMKLASFSRSSADYSEIERVRAICDGLTTWKNSLLIGVVPENAIWPEEPLLLELCKVVTEMDLPRIAKRHNSLVPAAVKGILGLVLNYYAKLGDLEDNADSDFQEKSWEDYKEPSGYEQGGISDDESTDPTADMKLELIDSLLDQFSSDWTPPLQGLAILDDIYGPSHGLLVASNDGDEAGRSGSPGSGFGIYDGIWKHQGWRQIETIQTQLREMSELKHLISSLGKRPSTTGDRRDKYPPQISNKRGGLGIVRTSYIPSEVTGIRRSNSLEGLLPSESMLLAIGRGAPLAHTSETPTSNSSSMLNLETVSYSGLTSSSPSNTTSTSTFITSTTSTMKRIESIQSLSGRLSLLFRAKLIERSLASYELSGWEDQRSSPKRSNLRYYPKLPTSVGGPIIVCLDMSWSMIGPREFLAKAIVFESTVMAVKQNRPCFVLGFSGRGNLAECDISLQQNKNNFQNLLQLLGNTFHGGTDVTAPLLRAFEMIESKSDSEWSYADILLVTDGELSMPPIPHEMLEKLRGLELDRGVKIHGLLVGRNESVPLEMLCTNWDGENRLHNFLYKFDPVYSAQPADGGSASSAVSSSYGDSYSSSTNKKEKRSKRLSTRLRSSLHDSETGLDTYGEASQLSAELPSVILSRGIRIGQVKVNRYVASLGDAEHSLWEGMAGVKSRFKRAVSVLEENLVERETASRLVLLAALSQEHILLLGPPGTGKSELGRRLASISGGSFFERLLTRYTTPEELFGPLSLAALEKDEYVRNINGYLPTATVAFLDEIFKSNSAILNSLLTILNERMFDNGNNRISVPLLAVVAASNELPDSEELEALYDRFLLRFIVNPVSDQNIVKLLQIGRNATLKSSRLNLNGDGSDGEGDVKLIDQDLVEEILQLSQKVKIPEEVVELLQDIRIFLREGFSPSVPCSDRRLVKALQLLTVSAVTNGRDSVGLSDCLLLQYVFWYNPEDLEKIRDWLWRRVVSINNLEGMQFLIRNSLQSLIQTYVIDDSQEGVLQGATDPKSEFQKEITELGSILINKISQLNQNIHEFHGENSNGNAREHIWFCATDKIAMKQQIVPQLLKGIGILERLFGYIESIAWVLEREEASYESKKDKILEIWSMFKQSPQTKLSDEIEDGADEGTTVDRIENKKATKKGSKKKGRFQSDSDD